MMKRVFTLALVALALTACKKEEDDAIELDEIVYRQVNGSFKYTLPLNLDVNNDGQDDFTFGNVLVSDAAGAHNLFYIRPLEYNQVLLNLQEEVSLGHWVEALRADEAVEEDLAKKQQWGRDPGFVLDLRQTVKSEVFYEGPLTESNTLFVGVRLMEDEKYKTGWVRLNYTVGSDEVEVNDVAFRLTPNRPLKAGQQ
ncbi:hypothetical protein [Pontibacter mangrovi]|uniref:Uncharacterized protein n=1 Tax=Pontibacter mangrovi TaxID=2589816 RepID=A0A501WFR1_9BACT|nr:hypothetical protein [Pontibacter mangrovi]TPE44366.1 hypothetical protein FJM65_09455 [Pontibacter mangrovi]